MTSWEKTVTSEHLFENIFILRSPRVAIFAKIIKIVTMFIQKMSLKI